MMIKRKLHLAYLLLVLWTLMIGAIATWSVAHWKATALELSSVHLYSLRLAEARGDIYRQVKEIADLFHGGDPDAREEFRQIEYGVKTALASLLEEKRSAAEGVALESLQATYQDLVAFAEAAFAKGTTGETNAQQFEEEIEDLFFPRLENRILALQDVYRTEEQQTIAATAVVARRTWLLVGVITLCSFVQGGFLLLGLERWLVKPLSVLGRATAIISTGDLKHRIPIHTADELGTLAQAINQMAVSLQAIQAQLVQAERLATLGELVSYIAHNIRNPLAGLRAAAQVSIEEGEGDPETMAEMIATVDRLERWVQNLLVYMRSVSLQLVPQELNQLIEQVLVTLQPDIAAKGLQPELRLAPLPLVAGDASWLEQILAALLSNAIEASAPAAQLVITSAVDAGRVTVHIADTARGIPSHLLEQVFRPYFTTKPKGIGLGLSMAKKIIEAHGGTIALHSKEGRGTTVTLAFPPLDA